MKLWRGWVCFWSKKLTESNQDNSTKLNQKNDSQEARKFAQQGETDRLMKHYEEAIANFNRAIALKPNYPWAIAHRGEVFRLIESYEKAIADFSHSLLLKSSAWTLAHRGASYYKLKHYQKALLDLNQAIDLQPNYPWAIIYKINIYILMERYEEALIDFDRTIALDDTIILSCYGERGLLLSYLGRYDEAISCCETGGQKNPNDYITLYTLAVIKAHCQGLAAAQAEIDKTRQILIAQNTKPGCAGVIYRLGGLAAIQGNLEQALNYLQTAISLDNEPLELARRDLAWLELRQNSHFKFLTKRENFT